jgi:triosephosphate isomerase (TIM)
MNLDHVEAIHLSKQVGLLLRQRGYEDVDVALAPPFVDIRSVTSVIEADRLPLTVTAQHVHHADAGAYTGEVSASMLRRLGVTRVLVGHSERRQMHDMADEVVAATMQAVWRHGLTAVLCVGEDAMVRDSGGEDEFVTAQVRRALAGAPTSLASQLVIAYEPIWAIGTGRTAESSQVVDMMSTVRKAIPEALQGQVPVLYGGSVKASNAGSLITSGDTDGFLVGGASLSAEEFVGIVGAVADCYPVGR